MILPNEIAKKIEECCVKIDNLEKALALAIKKVRHGYAYGTNEGLVEDEEVEEIINNINRLKEGKEECDSNGNPI